MILTALQRGKVYFRHCCDDGLYFRNEETEAKDSQRQKRVRADLPDFLTPVLSIKPYMSSRLTGKQVYCLKEVDVLRSSLDPLLSVNASPHCTYFTISKFLNVDLLSSGQISASLGLSTVISSTQQRLTKLS